MASCRVGKHASKLKILILNGILIVEVVNQNDTDDSAFPQRGTVAKA